MTRLLLDPARDLTAVDEATARLLDALEKLDPASVAEPSQLPGWTRGHVLAHLSRNADSLVNLCTWARTGEETPQYPSAEARDQAIEEHAGRSLDEHLADLRDSAERLRRAAEDIPAQAWATQVTLRSGRVIAAAELPWRRLIEINLHHVDLGIGCTPEDLPADFTARELEFVLGDLRAHEGIAAVRLVDSAASSQWDLGAADQPEAVVTGTTAALLAWVTGRGSGEGLAIDPEGPLPTLPPLG